MLPAALQPPDAHREMAQAIVSNAADYHSFLNLCEGCGLPVQDRRDLLNAQVEFASSFLRNFFPEQI